MESLRFEELESGAEITIDTLASMMAKGFAYNDTRFNAVESRLDRLENLLMERQEQRMHDLEARMKRLEDAVAL